MDYRHKLTGRPLRLLEARPDGRGLFKDGSSRVLCAMDYVTSGPEFGAEMEVKDTSHYVALSRITAPPKPQVTPTTMLQG